MLGYYNYTVILTYVGMLMGFSGITSAINCQYSKSIIFLILAGVCDMFDGSIAATRKRSTEEKNFGIQIDSLSDLICFGALPAFLVYNMNQRSSLAFIVSAIYLLCALIRLAFFNVDEAIRQSKTTERRKYYLGLPVTLSALFLPLMYIICNALKVEVNKFYIPALLIMATAFLTPFKLKKVHFVHHTETQECDYNENER